MSNSVKKPLYIYIAITITCGLFSFIYEHFSHNVYSNFIVYLFVIPLVLGVVPQLVALIYPKLAVGGSWQKTMHNFAIATLTAGAILQGIVEIYGTSTTFTRYYFEIGVALLALGIAMWIIRLRQAK